MKTYTDKQLLRWAARQRHMYRIGKLSAYKIAKLESLPGWHWGGFPLDPPSAYPDEWKGWDDFLGVPARGDA